MSISNIKSKLTQAISIKSDMLAAFSSRGLPVTSSTPFAQFPSLIMDIHDTVQAKEAFPRAEGVVVTPDAGYTALTQVTIPSEPSLIPENIVAGKSIYSVAGVAIANNPIADFLNNRFAELDDSDGVLKVFNFICANNPFLSRVNLPSVSTLYSGCFSNCVALKTVIMPSVTVIPGSAFYSCLNLTSVTLGTVTTVGSSAFYDCKNLDPWSIVSTATTVYSSAFYGAPLSRLLPNFIETIPSGMYGNTSISHIPSSEASLVRTVGQSAFAYCPLQEVSLPNCTGIDSYGFYMCKYLETVYLPMCAYIGSSAFVQCSYLRNLYVSNVQTIQSQAFAYTSNLYSVYLGCSEPHTSMLGNYALSGARSLRTVIFEGPWSFTAISVFYSCVSLYNIYLRHSEVMSLSNSYFFYGCPIGSRNSSARIYVPASLLASYKVAPQWSYFSSLFAELEA